ncbi:secreted RxLR effector protein 161-like [Rutidosis leptorrhynchoides]|uniref:secreted RxLR effector protein 161-like n=1 Tax=Rutidosis leptorrhynchoides TaxID=125765 RepID=UPI003A9A2039
MKIPQGFSKEGETRVCRLKKSIYGLKQASRNWYHKFTQALIALGFCRSEADHSLFMPSAFPIEQIINLIDVKVLQKNDAKSYRRLVGHLLYLQATRPDITYSVNILSQFADDPRQPHLDAVHRVLRYLKTIVVQGVSLPRDGGFDLSAYCDFDWLGCPYTRKSRTEYILLLGGAPIS